MKNKIICGDSAEKLKKIEDNSVDLIVTDQPYRYGFMGKNWDLKKDFTVIWEECLRVLKPGAFAFIMNAPRSDCQLLLLTELANAGFDIKFSPIFWTYASGFPKAMNISKAIEKRKGIKGIKIPASEVGFMKPDNQDWHQTKHQIIMPKIQTNIAKKFDGSYAGFQPKPAVEMINIVMKPLSEKSYIDQVLKNGKGITWLNDCRIPYSEILDGLNTLKYVQGLTYNKDVIVPFGQSNTAKENYKIDLKNKEKRRKKIIALKENAKNEKYNINSPEYRKAVKEDIESSPQFQKALASFNKLKKKLVGGRLSQEKRWTFADEKVDGYKTQDFDDVDLNLKGRFPANLLISDRVLDMGKNMKTGDVNPHKSKGTSKIYGDGKGYLQGKKITSSTKGDSGDYSRYFSLDNWWKEHIKELPKKIQKTFPFLYCSKASKQEKDKGLKNLPLKTTEGMRKNAGPALVEKDYSKRTQMHNTHPTVKSIKLMSYLITLGSRPRDVILDPFAGSGTTGIACKLEDRQFILIEKEKEYYDLMKKRLKSYKTQRKLM